MQAGVSEVIQTIRSITARNTIRDFFRVPSVYEFSSILYLRKEADVGQSDQTMTFRLDVDMKLFDAVAEQPSKDDDSHSNVDQLGPALVRM